VISMMRFSSMPGSGMFRAAVWRVCRSVIPL
jgi:hypothetical protein